MFINECVDKTNDFSLFKEDEPRILYLPGHISVYFGDEYYINSEIFNVIDSTSVWNRGIQFSYVEKNKKRFNKKKRKQFFIGKSMVCQINGFISLIIAEKNFLKKILHMVFFLKKIK